MSDPTWIVPRPQPKGAIAKLVYVLKAHPLLFLLLLTPGIPEYLSASSQLTVMVINPVLFFLFLAANLGLYGSGVILIREAMIRWRKGWASVFLLGAAYGIAEEGLDLWTLFYSNAGPVGTLGYYGHWLGVNWVWTMGLVIFHSVYSIGLPIFLFGLAFPELKSKSLVSGLRVKTTLVTLIIEVRVCRRALVSGNALRGRNLGGSRHSSYSPVCAGPPSRHFHPNEGLQVDGNRE